MSPCVKFGRAASPIFFLERCNEDRAAMPCRVSLRHRWIHRRLIVFAVPCGARCEFRDIGSLGNADLERVIRSRTQIVVLQSAPNRPASILTMESIGIEILTTTKHRCGDRVGLDKGGIAGQRLLDDIAQEPAVPFRGLEIGRCYNPLELGSDISFLDFRRAHLRHLSAFCDARRSPPGWCFQAHFHPFSGTSLCAQARCLGNQRDSGPICKLR